MSIQINYYGAIEVDGMTVSFHYDHGAYVTASVDGKAVDVINVYDYEKGASTITCADDLKVAIEDYMADRTPSDFINLYNYS